MDAFWLLLLVPVMLAIWGAGVLAVLRLSDALFAHRLDDRGEDDDDAAERQRQPGSEPS